MQTGGTLNLRFRLRIARLAMVVAGMLAVGGLVLLTVNLLRQQQHFNEVLASSGHDTMYAVLQLELETMRLIERMGAFVDSQAPADADEVRDQYEIFINGVGLVNQSFALEELSVSAPLTAMHSQVSSFVEKADKVLGHDRTYRLTPEAASKLLQAIDRLALQMRRVAREEITLYREQTTRRNTELHEQTSQAMVGLLVQSIGFSVLALWGGWQFWRIKKRQRRTLASLQRLRTTRIEAQSALRDRMAWLTSTNHEALTQSRVMLNRLAVMGTDELSDTQRERLKGVEDAAQTILVRLYDIGGLISIHTDTPRQAHVPCDVSALVEESLDLFRPAVRGKGVQLYQVLLVDPELRWLKVDAFPLRQIVNNLLSNATRATDEGFVRIHLSAIRREPCLPPVPASPLLANLRLIVQDSSRGSSAELLPRPFGQVEQAGDSVLWQKAGVGVGLQISRALARQMGGDLKLRSDGGGRRVFELVLPALQVAPAKTVVPRLAPELPLIGALKLLVAEDNAIVRTFLAAMLGTAGHTVTFAKDGVCALEFAKRDEFDAILMDVHMPGMDGLAATRAIRQLESKVAGIPIILLTAGVTPAIYEAAMEAGADMLVDKLARYTELLQALAVTQVGSTVVTAERQ